jgi:hypothetical protein
VKKDTTKQKNFDNLLKSSISAAESIEGDPQDLSVINDYLSEYLKSFVLLGYDTKGESVVIIAGKNPQDYDAIETLLRRVGKIDFFDTTQEQKGNPDNE